MMKHTGFAYDNYHNTVAHIKWAAFEQCSHAKLKISSQVEIVVMVVYLGNSMDTNAILSRSHSTGVPCRGCQNGKRSSVCLVVSSTKACCFIFLVLLQHASEFQKCIYIKANVRHEGVYPAS